MPNNKDELSLAGTKIKAAPLPKEEFGVDLDNELVKKLVDSAENNVTDLGTLENFLSVSQSREQVYELIDTMSQDSMISAILETYAEDVCEPNDRGQIVWAESTDDNVTKLISYFLDTMNVDKHIYK
jgi:hypothetical protein